MAFWNRKKEDVRPEESVRISLIEAEQLLADRPKAALKLLDKLKGERYALVGFGGEFHEDFQRIVKRALDWKEESPGVAAFKWKHWDDYPTIADVLDLARKIREPLLFLYEPPTRFSRGPVVEIEGLRILSRDEQMVMLVIGESNTFLRRDLLINLQGSMDPDSEEILQDILDASKESGFRTLSVAG